MQKKDNRSLGNAGWAFQSPVYLTNLKHVVRYYWLILLPASSKQPIYCGNAS